MLVCVQRLAIEGHLARHPPCVRGSLGDVLASAFALAPDPSLPFARSVAACAVSAYSRALRAPRDAPRAFCAAFPDFPLEPLPGCLSQAARSLGVAAAGLDAARASDLLGGLYTGLMPAKRRARFGAWYTHPLLCEHLLDAATDAGVDWRTVRVLDPACGAGVFLLCAVRRMARSLGPCEPAERARRIAQRLVGLELDPFAAWMAQIFLDGALIEACGAHAVRRRRVVRVCDALDAAPRLRDRFGLVVGNPPFARVTLSPALREIYRRSLYGHANLYGVFMDLGLRALRAERGVLAYVTPTSFFGGAYFKALRGLLAREAPPVRIDFIAERKGVFAGVLQETALSVYRRGARADGARVRALRVQRDGAIESTAVGTFGLPRPGEQPWLVPRWRSQSALLCRAVDSPHRLIHYGYGVRTGPFVWNRHKTGLRTQPARGRHPVVWAEAVRADATFAFRAERHGGKLYYAPQADEGWLVTHRAGVLVQRTTAREQPRRLVAAELPAAFVAGHAGVVVENHLNLLIPLDAAPRVAPAVLAALLNTRCVDALFRCISGSVAVSAYELEALPLPAPDSLAEFGRLVRARALREALEQCARCLYDRHAPDGSVREPASDTPLRPLCA